MRQIMIRLIHIGDQIDDEADNFAWFDTTCDRFIELGGCQVWDNWEEFVFDCIHYPGGKFSTPEQLEQFEGLFYQRDQGE